MSTTPASKKRSSGPKRKKPARKYGAAQIHTFLLSMAGITTVLIGCALAWFLLLDIPDVRSAGDYRPKVASIILDRNGHQVDMMGATNRITATMEQMPKLLPLAFVAAEDSRFFDHSGLDFWSIFRAAINNVRSGKRSQGGSTITQQVTRALMLSREKTYFRKFTESILAYRLDTLLTKQEILYIYLNEIYLGQGAYGVEAAARTYFGKRARQLSLSEIAILAGLPQSPSRYSPLRNPEAAKARQRYVLNRMAEDGIITAQSARSAYNRELHYVNSVAKQSINGYFTQYIRELLTEQYGPEKLYREGLTIMTTLDSRLQKQAAQALRQGCAQIKKRNSTKPAPQGALVALDRKNGRLRVMVGGTDFTQTQYNRALRANRQPGSVFKPLVFAAAFEQGWQPGSQLEDRPISIRNRDGSTWSPKNYDNQYLGPTTLAEGLIHSRNIVAIKLLQQTGFTGVGQIAKKAGITAPLNRDLTLALGSSPVSLLEMTGSYSIFANQGNYIAPVAITSIRDHKGNHIPWPQSRPVRVLSPKVATTMNNLLSQVITKGTGTKARGIAHAAGKTGTSDNNTDAWFVGYTSKYIAGVWLGHDRNSTLGAQETGGKAAAPVWKDFMQHAGQ